MEYASAANLRAVFEGVIGRGNLVCSVDNYGLLRPTRSVPTQRLPPQAPCRTDVTTDVTNIIERDGLPEDMAGWKTKSKWLHWDLSPFHWVAQTMPPYNDFDINLTRLSSVASANADSTITTVPCRVLCILLHALFA